MCVCVCLSLCMLACSIPPSPAVLLLFQDTVACTVYHITNMSDDEERIDVGESEDLNNDSSMAGLQFPVSPVLVLVLL